MMKSNIVENPHGKGLHTHFCFTGDHRYECGEDCECVCGLPMQSMTTATVLSNSVRAPSTHSIRSSRRQKNHLPKVGLSPSPFLTCSILLDSIANADVRRSTPARLWAGACIAITFMPTTHRRSKIGTSPTTAPECPLNSSNMRRQNSIAPINRVIYPRAGANDACGMAIDPNRPDKVQIRLTSSAETILAALEPFKKWIEQTLDAPLSGTLTLEMDCNPGDLVAEELLQGLAILPVTKQRNRNWRSVIESWALPPGTSPRIAVSLQRERRPNAEPLPVWELDWQNCPVALKLRGLARQVISVKIPTLFPPGDMPVIGSSPAQHRFIVHRQDAAKVLLLEQEVQSRVERYLETQHSRTRLQGRYDWESVVLDATAHRMVRTDFELFFEREHWFHQHNLPYRRGYLLWGPPGNGKSQSIRVMAAHPHICPFAIDLSDMQEKTTDVMRMFEKAAQNTPALVILEDLDRAFPTEGKRTQERTVSFQTLLNCLDGVGTQDGVIVVATANDPTCLDPAILKRPGRFDRVVYFRNPDAELRRQYYKRLSPILAGEQFEIAIGKTEGFSFAQLRETYILGAQSAFEHGRDVGVEDVVEAIELQAAGAQDLKTSVPASGFVRQPEPSGR